MRPRLSFIARFRSHYRASAARREFIQELLFRPIRGRRNGHASKRISTGVQLRAFLPVKISLIIQYIDGYTAYRFNMPGMRMRT